MRDTYQLMRPPREIWLVRRGVDPPRHVAPIRADIACFGVAGWLRESGAGVLRELAVDLGVASDMSSAIQGGLWELSADGVLGLALELGAWAFEGEILRRRLERALCDGELRAFGPALRGAAAAGSRGAGRPEPPPPPPFAPAPEREEEEKSWILISVVDGSNPPRPVAWQPYRFELPDGSVCEGRLDRSGQAYLAGIEPGVGKLSFPRIDAREIRRA
jgi:hypothetical protein